MMKQNKLIQLFKALLVSVVVFLIPVNSANALPGFGNNAPCTTCHSGSTPSSSNVIACPAGQSRDSITHLCMAPAPVACLGNSFSTTGMTPCDACPLGTTANASHTACDQPAPPCGGGQVSNGVCQCPATQTLIGGTCQCPSGQTMNGGVCSMPNPVPTPSHEMEDDGHHDDHGTRSGHRDSSGSISGHDD